MSVAQFVSSLGDLLSEQPVCMVHLSSQLSFRISHVHVVFSFSDSCMYYYDAMTSYAFLFTSAMSSETT